MLASDESKVEKALGEAALVDRATSLLSLADTSVDVAAKAKKCKPCDGGKCDQQGCLGPTCDGGKCHQAGSLKPTCDGGKCDQSASINATCDGGHCDQIGCTGCTCKGFGCKTKAVATKPHGDAEKNRTIVQEAKQQKDEEAVDAVSLSEADIGAEMGTGGVMKGALGIYRLGAYGLLLGGLAVLFTHANLAAL